MSNEKVIIIIYINDILIAKASIINVKKAKKLFRKRFKVTNFKKVKTCIGIYI